MELLFINISDPLYQSERRLRSRELREPLGFPPGAELFPFEDESLHLVAVEEGNVIGCALFHPVGKSGRLYQMAVSSTHRKCGIGSALMEAMEHAVMERGGTDIRLHARETAVSFYERLGYRMDGSPFIEIGIPHIAMIKVLKA